MSLGSDPNDTYGTNDTFWMPGCTGDCHRRLIRNFACEPEVIRRESRLAKKGPSDLEGPLHMKNRYMHDLREENADLALG